jgi:hypothetical protein
MLHAVLFLLAASVTSSAATSVAGPPAICFPLDIGEARSLAWGGDDAFDADPDFPREKLVAEVVAVLDASDDALVHAETLRRAVIYAAGGHGKKDPATRARCAELVQALQTRALDAELAASKQKIEDHERALHWLDLGFALGAYDQMEVSTFAPALPPLQRAAELAPRDAGVALAAWLASWTRDSDPAQRDPLLAAAVRLADDPKSLVRHNLMNVAGHFLGIETYDQLAAKVGQSGQRGS